MTLQSYFDEFTDRDWTTGVDGNVRFALIGLGFWTVEYVLPAIESTELCTATTVVSGSGEKANRTADEWETVDHAITYDEYHDGRAVDAYDAVYVATPNALHLEYAEIASEFGKAVLCEKPMEGTLERSEKMVRACEEGDVPLMVGYRMQTEPVVRRTRELIRDGFIGDPVLVQGYNSQPALDFFSGSDHWRLNPDLSGYGTSVMDVGIYPLNTARFLLDSDPVAANSMMRSSHEAFDRVPDEYCVFSLEFDNGAYAACTSTQNGCDRTRLEIIGSKGTIEIDPAFHYEAELSVSRDEMSAEFTVEQVDEMTELFEYFADHLLSDVEFGPDGRHGLVDMRATKAIYDANQTGETVHIDE